MKLFLGEVGVGSIVDVRPVGQWLGVSIPLEPWVFVFYVLVHSVGHLMISS